MQTHDFEEDASDAPQIHAVGVVSVGEEALRRAIPPSGYVLGVRRLAVHGPARTEIRQFQHLVLYEYIFRLNVPVKYSASVHMVYRFQ